MRSVKDCVIVVWYGCCNLLRYVLILGLSRVAALYNHDLLSMFLVPPEGHFLLANFSQKFDGNAFAPLSLRIQKPISDPKGSFYSIFCEKIVWKKRMKKIVSTDE